MKPQLGWTKHAWIRDRSVPPGQPAKGKINCPCGGAPETWYKQEETPITCACGTVYTYDGWIIDQPEEVYIEQNRTTIERWNPAFLDK